jgi:hypothetical protein
VRGSVVVSGDPPSGSCAGPGLAALPWAGRLPRRIKIKEAPAALLLGRGSDVLQALITAQQPVFQEAERIARQALAVAKLKGLALTPGGGVPQQQFLHELQDRLAADPDLATVNAHIAGLVGTTDALVFLDRALVSVA